MQIEPTNAPHSLISVCESACESRIRARRLRSSAPPVSRWAAPMKTYSSNRAILPLVGLLPLLAALAAACGGRAFSAGHESGQGQPTAQDATAISSDANGLEN